MGSSAVGEQGETCLNEIGPQTPHRQSAGASGLSEQFIHRTATLGSSLKCPHPPGKHVAEGEKKILPIASYFCCPLCGKYYTELKKKSAKYKGERTISLGKKVGGRGLHVLTFKVIGDYLHMKQILNM